MWQGDEELAVCFYPDRLEHIGTANDFWLRNDILHRGFTYGY